MKMTVTFRFSAACFPPLYRMPNREVLIVLCYLSVSTSSNVHCKENGLCYVLKSLLFILKLIRHP